MSLHTQVEQNRNDRVKPETVVPYRRYFSPEEIRTIAAKIDRLAKAGRTIRLLPTTGMMAADAMHMFAARPSRNLLVSLLCHAPTQCADNKCIRCIGKANQIIRVIEGRS